MQFESKEDAVNCFNKTSTCSIEGRLIHILPAKAKILGDDDPIKLLEDEEFGKIALKDKDKKELKKRLNATKDFNWNTLFMSQNAVADSIANKLGVTKDQILEQQSNNDSVAARLAIAEAQITLDSKKYFEDVYNLQ